MRHGFGCAAGLYAKNIHPRVLLGPEDVARLRVAVRRGAGRKVFDALRVMTAPVIDWALAEPSPESFARNVMPGPRTYEGMAWRLALSIQEMAMVAVLGDDAQAERARRATCRVLVESPDAWLHALFSYHAVAFDLLADSLTDAQRRQYVARMVPAVYRLGSRPDSDYYQNAGGNGTLCDMFVGIIIALSIRGEPAIADTPGGHAAFEALVAKLVHRLRASLNAAVNPDGYPEEDVGYGTSVVCSLAKNAEMVSRAGLWDAFRLCPRLRLAGRAILHFVQPWGEHLAITGDFGGASCDHREALLARLAHLNRDPSLLWLLGTLHNDNRMLKTYNPLGDGAVEVPIRKGFQLPATMDTLVVLDRIGKPAHPSRARVPLTFHDCGRGLVTFRDRWADDASLVIFDGSQRSPAAPGHPHASGGHFSFTSLGEYFAIDLNRYGTEQSEHNVVLVNGKSGRSTHGKWGMLEYNHALLTAYRPGPLVDLASADSSLQHDCYWARRTILFVKGKGVQPYLVTIDDVNKNNDFNEFWWTLNTCPENTVATRENHATITGWRRGNQLDVHFALPSPKEFPRPHTLTLAGDEPTTSSYDYIKNPLERAAEYIRPAKMVEGVVFVRPRLIGKVAGYNGRFMSLMLPRRAGESPAKVERLDSLPASLAVRVTRGNIEDTLIWAYEHDLLEAGDVRAVGRWCLVRRDARTGRVLMHEMERGVSLIVAGRERAL